MLFRNLKYDIPAGITVFLVALPLSLGIALASGAPLFSGLIASIVGGLVVIPISKSTFGVSGAAAGLFVIMLTNIQELSFSGFLLAVIFAGIFQILMGMAKMGAIAHYFPTPVIKGMLSGIGLIIFLKQIPHAIGYDGDYEGDLSFFQNDDFSTFSELSHMMEFSSPSAILIACCSLVILAIWEQPHIKKSSFFQMLHGSLATILFGVAVNYGLKTFYPELELKESHLVDIPVADDFSQLFSQLPSPDFSQLNNPAIYVSALMLAFIASLETLLAIEAVDRLDIHKRVTPPNHELIAQGIGNIISGLLGGLPITQVIIRSSINVHSGAKTKMSGFFAGALLCVAVLFAPNG